MRFTSIFIFASSAASFTITSLWEMFCNVISSPSRNVTGRVVGEGLLRENVITHIFNSSTSHSAEIIISITHLGGICKYFFLSNIDPLYHGICYAAKQPHPKVAYFLRNVNSFFFLRGISTYSACGSIRASSAARRFFVR